jgi:Uma2 family endonuclease
MSNIEIAQPPLEFPVPARIGPEHNGMLLTLDEFESINDGDDLYHYELIRGVVVVSPLTDFPEASLNEDLNHRLRSYRDNHPAGSSLSGTCYLVPIRTLQSHRRIDRAIWCGLGRYPEFHNDVPAITIEIVSERTRDWMRDRIEKRDEFFEIGVKEYWVVDRFRRIVTVYRGATEERVVKESEVYTTDLLPGFELNLKRLLEIADRSTASSS